MIYAITATREGKEAIANYSEGEQEGLPLLHAVVLTTAVAIEDRAVTMLDLVRVVQSNFPVALGNDGLTSVIERLENSGFIRVIREVTDSNRIIVDVYGLHFITTVGALLAANPAMLCQGDKLRDELKWHGAYTFIANGTGNEITARLR